MTRFDFYTTHGVNYFKEFRDRNQEFQTNEFTEFVVLHNKADRDTGELSDIAKHEVLRLAYEFAEYKHRCGSRF